MTNKELSTDNVVTVRCDPLGNLGSLGQRWRELESIAKPSPFLCWFWIGSWLSLRESWPDTFEVTAWQGPRLVGIAIVCMKQVVRARFIPSTALFLNEAGTKRYDMTIEHNGVLLDPQYKVEVLRAFFNFVKENWPDVDELETKGVGEAMTFRTCAGTAWSWQMERESRGYFVDLAKLRDEGRSFIETLSKKRRYQVRRSIRAFEEHGEISVTRAADEAAAKIMFHEMKALHEAYWRTKERPGAFSWPERVAFFLKLIEQGVPRGEVDVIRVSAGEEIIGTLFNLRRDGTVYFIQSGFNYTLDAKRQPGYVALVKIIQWYADGGEDKFDFLAGHEGYKRELCTQHYTLSWGSFRRKRVKFFLEAVLRDAKRLMENNWLFSPK